MQFLVAIFFCYLEILPGRRITKRRPFLSNSVEP